MLTSQLTGARRSLYHMILSQHHCVVRQHFKNTAERSLYKPVLIAPILHKSSFILHEITMEHGGLPWTFHVLPLCFPW